MTAFNNSIVSDYETFLREELQDREVAAEYLAAAIEGGSLEEFELALRTVADACGIGEELARLMVTEQGAKAFAKENIPMLISLVAILRSIGLTLTVKPLEQF